MTPAYKILAASEWAAVPPGGAWGGSDVDRADGFIHLSTGDQLYETAAKHYAGQGGLMILTLDADHPPLEALIRWEPSRGGALFPHIYGPLPIQAVIRDDAFAVGDDGRITSPWR